MGALKWYIPSIRNRNPNLKKEERSTSDGADSHRKRRFDHRLRKKNTNKSLSISSSSSKGHVPMSKPAQTLRPVLHPGVAELA